MGTLLRRAATSVAVSVFLLLALATSAGAITDKFTGVAATLDNPATAAFAITPSDSSDLASVSRAIYVGGAGDVKVTMADGASTVTFVAVPAGTLLPFRVNRVFATGTTATSLVAVY